MSPGEGLPDGSLRLFSYSKCSTCRKALQWLAAHGIVPVVVDITTCPPSAAELAHAWDRLGEARRLFNTSGQSYRALGAAAVKAMTRDEAIAALAADGRLIRRPFLITPDGEVLTGFDPVQWARRLPVPDPAPDRAP